MFWHNHEWEQRRGLLYECSWVCPIFLFYLELSQQQLQQLISCLWDQLFSFINMNEDIPFASLFRRDVISYDTMSSPRQKGRYVEGDTLLLSQCVFNVLFTTKAPWLLIGGESPEASPFPFLVVKVSFVFFVYINVSAWFLEDLVLIKEAVSLEDTYVSCILQLTLSTTPPEWKQSSSCQWPTCLQHQRKRTGGVGETGRGGGRGENMWESAMINVLSEMEWGRERKSGEQGHLRCMVVERVLVGFG